MLIEFSLKVGTRRSVTRRWRTDATMPVANDASAALIDFVNLYTNRHHSDIADLSF